MSRRFLLILAASTFLFLISSSFLISRKKEGGEVDLAFSCFPSSFSGEIYGDDIVAVFEGKKIEVPFYAMAPDKLTVLSLAHGQRYIEVDLSEQKLRAWEGNKLFLETPVSTGLPWWPTPLGEFRIWIKLRAAKMEGGSGRYYYYLPNVPYIMYFENEKIPGWRGYGLHGTYWHNDFGRPRSHGCVNIPTPVAKELYYWTGPVLPEGKNAVRSSEDNPGTRIVIHE